MRKSCVHYFICAGCDGARAIALSAIRSLRVEPTREESLEEMQDNKMANLCEKLLLREGESLLDIGCGWGTLAKFASVNYCAKVNEGLLKAGIPWTQSKASFS